MLFPPFDQTEGGKEDDVENDDDDKGDDDESFQAYDYEVIFQPKHPSTKDLNIYSPSRQSLTHSLWRRATKKSMG